MTERRSPNHDWYKNIDSQSVEVAKILSDISPQVASPTLGNTNRCIKRSFDIIFAVSALIVLAIPMLILAILIKIDSNGPVLFRQVRVGFGNQPFTIFKFRSLKIVGNGAPHIEQMTRLGRFLRISSADETPQIFNVLRGDMSIVGPRPHTIDSTAAGKLFWEIDARYWVRHRVKPGLTGLAQIKGYLGRTIEKDDFAGRLKYDLQYIENWSLFLDLKIILATLHVVARGQDVARNSR